MYKGILSNQQQIAVKHIINDGNVETFVREVTSLSHIKHPNLVTLLGYCISQEEGFLIYEFCPNGNLAKWLFGMNHKRLIYFHVMILRTMNHNVIDCRQGQGTFLDPKASDCDWQCSRSLVSSHIFRRLHCSPWYQSQSENDISLILSLIQILKSNTY